MEEGLVWSHATLLTPLPSVFLSLTIGLLEHPLFQASFPSILVRNSFRLLEEMRGSTNQLGKAVGDKEQVRPSIMGIVAYILFTLSDWEMEDQAIKETAQGPLHLSVSFKSPCPFFLLISSL